MGSKAGFALKLLQWFNRGVQFGCCAVVLALFSYFLTHLHRNNLPISNHVKAVEGISGIGVLYTLLALVLLCCLAGIAFASAIAILLDIAFVGAFIYVASRLGGGTNSCSAPFIDTPIGSGDPRADTFLSNACRMEKACLAVSIIAIFFFLFSAITEIFLARNHRREKRFGPGPNNGYTSGSGTKPSSGLGSTRRSGAGAGGFLGRFLSKRGRRNDGMTGDELPQHTNPDQVRDSYATDATAVGSHHAPAERYSAGTNAYKHEQPGVGAGTGTYGQETGHGVGTGTYGQETGHHGLDTGTYGQETGRHGVGTGTYGQETGVAPNELPAQGVEPTHYPAGNYNYDDGTYNVGSTGRAV